MTGITKKRNKLHVSARLIMLLTSFLPLLAHSQSIMFSDTVLIGEVIIHSPEIEKGILNPAREVLDSASLARYEGRSLSVLLAENSDIPLRSYGVSGISSISLRGSGAAHTILLWNGININNPMPGQADFSTVGSSTASSVTVLRGSSSMISGSGGFGGAVEINSAPVWERGNRISISSLTGSYGYFSGSAAVRHSGTNLETNTRFCFSSAENNFRYLNNEATALPFWSRMNNSSSSGEELQQELYYRKGNTLLSGRLWYSSSKRKLPASMLNLQPGASESQFDESFRSKASYEWKSGKSVYSVTGAFLTGRLNYFNKLASIDSRNNSHTFILKASAETTIRNGVRYGLYLTSTGDIINSVNYNGSISRSVFSMTGFIEKKIFRHVETGLLIRETCNGRYFLSPDFSFTTALPDKLTGLGKITASFSKNSRLPSLNDLYWYPGGNRDLRTESALQYEAGYSVIRDIRQNNSIELNTNLFYSQISDMIIWQPRESSYWSAVNAGKVRTAGSETRLKITYHESLFDLTFNAGYTYTRAADYGHNTEFSKAQLVYIPVNQLYASGYLTVGDSWITVVTKYTGRRFTNAENTAFLPAYTIANLSIGTKLKILGQKTEFSIDTENIFGVSYQAIAHYPMPGRAFYFRITIILNRP